MPTTTDVSLVMDVCGVSKERAQELIEAAGEANSAERAIDLHFHQQTPTVPAPQLPSSSPLQTKKMKSRTRAAKSQSVVSISKSRLQESRHHKSFSAYLASPTVADEVQAHAQKKKKQKQWMAGVVKMFFPLFSKLVNYQVMSSLFL